MTGIPLASARRIIRKSGAIRVSADADAELAKLMEEHALVLAREALKLSAHAGRKTVTGHDIRMAAEILK
ncbi:MAG: NFYB/HAP3 family transcription factor subunit [Methanolinea sp.]|nr:NFYB/HAP3 family transcription factor subunit [Methanolinea sp.]